MKVYKGKKRENEIDEKKRKMNKRVDTLAEKLFAPCIKQYKNWKIIFFYLFTIFERYRQIIFLVSITLKNLSSDNLS